MGDLTQWIERATARLQVKSQFTQDYWAVGYRFDNVLPMLTTGDVKAKIDSVDGFPFASPTGRFGSRAQNDGEFVEQSDNWWNQRVWWCASSHGEALFAEQFGIGWIKTNTLFLRALAEQVRKQLEYARNLGATIAPESKTVDVHLIAVGLQDRELIDTVAQPSLGHPSRVSAYQACIVKPIECDTNEIMRGLLESFCVGVFDYSPVQI